MMIQNIVIYIIPTNLTIAKMIQKMTGLCTVGDTQYVAFEKGRIRLLLF